MNAEIESPYATQPVNKDHLQWRAVWAAGLVAGLILSIVPRASPWSSLTFFAPVIMGRVVPEELGMPLILSKTMHFALSMLYGLIISLVVVRITQLRAVLVGAVLGLLLYFANFGIVSAWIPALRGDEATVAFSHMFFGGIAAGAYRGLLRRQVAEVPDDETA